MKQMRLIIWRFTVILETDGINHIWLIRKFVGISYEKIEYKPYKCVSSTKIKGCRLSQSKEHMKLHERIKKKGILGKFIIRFPTLDATAIT